MRTQSIGSNSYKVVDVQTAGAAENTLSVSEELLNRWQAREQEQMEPVRRFQMSGIHYGKASVLLAKLPPEDEKAAKEAEKQERIKEAIEANKEKIKETMKDAAIGVISPLDAVRAIINTKEIVDDISAAAEGK